MSDEIYVPRRGSAMDSLLFVEEITHRVANEYTAAIGSISRAAARCTNMDARDAFTEAARLLLDHAEVHRALRPPPAAGYSDLGQHLRGLCEAIVRASLTERKIHLALLEESIRIEAKQCWIAGMIVSELITNAARHAQRELGGGIVVEISMRSDEVRCQVTDDGGCANPIPGRGMRIIKGLARELGGDVNWHFGKSGTAALLYFPRDQGESSLAA